MGTDRAGNREWTSPVECPAGSRGRADAREALAGRPALTAGPPGSPGSPFCRPPPVRAAGGRLSPPALQAALDRLSVDLGQFALRDLTLDLCRSRVMPIVSTPRSLDLAHLRTALWFHEQEVL